jgi:hypothetical protein
MLFPVLCAAGFLAVPVAVLLKATENKYRSLCNLVFRSDDDHAGFPEAVKTRTIRSMEGYS